MGTTTKLIRQQDYFTPRTQAGLDRCAPERAGQPARLFGPTAKQCFHATGEGRRRCRRETGRGSAGVGEGGSGRVASSPFSPLDLGPGRRRRPHHRCRCRCRCMHCSASRLKRTNPTNLPCFCFVMLLPPAACLSFPEFDFCRTFVVGGRDQTS